MTTTLFLVLACTLITQSSTPTREQTVLERLLESWESAQRAEYEQAPWNDPNVDQDRLNLSDAWMHADPNDVLRLIPMLVEKHTDFLEYCLSATDSHVYPIALDGLAAINVEAHLGRLRKDISSDDGLVQSIAIEHLGPHVNQDDLAKMKRIIFKCRTIGSKDGPGVSEIIEDSVLRACLSSRDECAQTFAVRELGKVLSLEESTGMQEWSAIGCVEEFRLREFVEQVRLHAQKHEDDLRYTLCLATLGDEKYGALLRGVATDRTTSYFDLVSIAFHPVAMQFAKIDPFELRQDIVAAYRVSWSNHEPSEEQQRVDHAAVLAELGRTSPLMGLVNDMKKRVENGGSGFGLGDICLRISLQECDDLRPLIALDQIYDVSADDELKADCSRVILHIIANVKR